MAIERSILRTILRTSPTAEYEDELSGMAILLLPYLQHSHIYFLHSSST
jgi:hypothetical protein